MTPLATLLWWLLGAVVLPVWLVAGVADYLCHARTDIEHTSGPHEAALHLLQTAEIGVPVLAFLFLEANASVLALMTAGVIAHALTSWRDLRYTAHRREITPAEQYVHGFLIVLPWVALALVVVLHWPVVQALAARGVPTDWGLRVRRPAFPVPALAPVLLASLVLGVLPGAREYLRTRAAAHASSSSARSATKPR